MVKDIWKSVAPSAAIIGKILIAVSLHVYFNIHRIKSTFKGLIHVRLQGHTSSICILKKWHYRERWHKAHSEIVTDQKPTFPPNSTMQFSLQLVWLSNWLVLYTWSSLPIHWGCEVKMVTGNCKIHFNSSVLAEPSICVTLVESTIQMKQVTWYYVSKQWWHNDFMT